MEFLEGLKVAKLTTGSRRYFQRGNLNHKMSTWVFQNLHLEDFQEFTQCFRDLRAYKCCTSSCEVCEALYYNCTVASRQHLKLFVLWLLTINSDAALVPSAFRNIQCSNFTSRWLLSVRPFGFCSTYLRISSSEWSLLLIRNTALKQPKKSS